jgi:nucleoside recognition membrane protein YjiH
MFKFTSIEASLLFIGFVLSVLRMTPLYVYLCPPLMPIGMWIATVPGTVTMRAAYLAMGISAVVLTARALVWKEPGLIEVEAVQ